MYFEYGIVMKFHILFFVLIPLLSLSQEGEIYGIIVNGKGDAIPNAHIYLTTLNKSTVSNTSGYFKIEHLTLGQHKITVSHVGYTNQEKVITLSKTQPHVKITIPLTEASQKLSTVTITGKTKTQKLRESVAPVSVLNTKELYAKNNNTSDVVKQISGINVRQSGGFGSNAEIFINGMTGKQVKFFLDGIPLSYYGMGLGINVIPVNLMERIEVYKGVVPVDFGADALGGAINIVSRNINTNFVDVAYSLGSFNTHKINGNGQYVNTKKNIKLGINSFYNYSDNNYKIDVEIPDKFGNPEPATVKRFHDTYSNYMLKLYAGVYKKNYADKLQIDVSYSGVNDDVQHNAIMAQPYGEASYNENILGVSINYEKKDILKGLNLKWYGGINTTKGLFKDVSLYTYTWDGNITKDVKNSGGELSSSGNLLHLTANNAISRFNTAYKPWKKGQFTCNIVTSWFYRTGKDPVAAEFYGEDFFANPTKLFKNATGLAYKHIFFEKLTSYTALKHFMFNADGYAIENMKFLPNQQAVSNIGYLQSFKYKFTNSILIKASYEYATRLPDEWELFGDFILARPNPFLNPEQSHNINFGAQWNTKKVKLGINTFYRQTDNVIWLRTSQFFAQYQNLLKSLTKGIEAEFIFKPLTFLNVKLNATYQDIRNRSPKNIVGAIDNRYYNARLPNIPYFFGNTEIRYQKENFLGGKNKLSAWWNANYVNEYFLYWEVDGNKDLKNRIPSQFIQNIGITYTLLNKPLSVTFESTNVFNNKVFDNFNVQRPGRALYVTLRTFFK